jgi:hypothetical protein
MRISHDSLKKLEIRKTFEYLKDKIIGKDNKSERNKELSDLEKLLHTDSYSLSDEDIINNKYLIKNLAKLGVVISNPENLKEDLVKKLKEIPHTYRNVEDGDGKPLYNELPENVYNLSTDQLLRVHVLVKSLQNDSELRNRIGSLLEENLENQISEYGGLVRFNENGEVIFNPIESDLPRKNMYILPFSARQIPHIAEFHFHASREDSSKSAGPSSGDYYNLIFATRSRSKRQGVHWLIISKLEGKKFNVDYMGKGPVVIDLGNYVYESPGKGKS